MKCLVTYECKNGVDTWTIRKFAKWEASDGVVTDGTFTVERLGWVEGGDQNEVLTRIKETVIDRQIIGSIEWNMTDEEYQSLGEVSNGAMKTKKEAVKDYGVNKGGEAVKDRLNSLLNGRESIWFVDGDLTVMNIGINRRMGLDEDGERIEVCDYLNILINDAGELEINRSVHDDSTGYQKEECERIY